VPYTYPSKLSSAQRELITAHYRASHPGAFSEAVGNVAAGDGAVRPLFSAAAGTGRAAAASAPVGGQGALSALDVDTILEQRTAVQRGPVLDAVREEQRQSPAEAAAAAAREADARRADMERQAAERQAADQVAEWQAVSLETERAAAAAAAAAGESGLQTALNPWSSGTRKRERPTRAELADRAAAQAAQGGGGEADQDDVEARTSRGGRQYRPSAWHTGRQ
jgi:hypothetical protein